MEDKNSRADSKACYEITYINLHGDHTDDALRWVVDGKEDNKYELHD